jgi:Sec-independent protein translocase protein TatA
MIPGIGSREGAALLIPLGIVPLFFGAKRLAELGKSFGIGVEEFHKETAGAENGNGAQKRLGNRDEREIVPNADRGGERSV